MGEDAEAPWAPEERAAIIAGLAREFPGRHFHPVRRGNLASMWESTADMARDRDAYCQEAGSWAQPGLAALVAAVRRTRLSRLCLFMGHEYLYFADGPGVWGEKGEVAPGCIANGPEGYVVFQGAVGYGPQGQVIPALTTHDPGEAATQAERVLAGWAWSGRES